MENFLDIKKAFENVPDEVLEVLRFGTGEGSEEIIQMVADVNEDGFRVMGGKEFIENKFKEYGIE